MFVDSTFCEAFYVCSNFRTYTHTLQKIHLCLCKISDDWINVFVPIIYRSITVVTIAFMEERNIDFLLVLQIFSSYQGR